MLELTVLIVSIIIVLLVLYFKNSNRYTETFENYYLKSCPSGFKTFYDPNGDVVCCDGDIMANKCLGDNQCTLTGPGTPRMPNCTDIILDMYKEKGQKQCTPSMPQYFENKEKQIRGCTSGSLNDTLDGPRYTSQQMCKIYPSDQDNYISRDSCYIQSQLDTMQCFGSNCTKDAVQPIPGAPILITVGFTDNMGVHHTAYSRDSITNFMNHVNPQWREGGFNIDTNIQVADVAKAYYVDRTMQASNVQWYV
jgi:hypothetical protein